MTYNVHVMHIGSMKLSQWMTATGKSDSEVALLIGRDRSMVSRFRRGEQTPPPALMQTIAAVTDGSVLPNDWFETLPDSQDAA